MVGKEYQQNPTPWWMWVLVGVAGLLALLIIYLMVDIYLGETDVEIKNNLGFYDDFSKTDYDKYYPEYDMVYLIENNFIKINRENQFEHEYGLNRENRTFSIIMDSKEATELEAMLAAKALAIGAQDIADDYSVQVFLDNNLKEPLLFLHNVDVIYSATDKNISLEDIEKYQ